MFFVGSDALFAGLDRSQACFLRLKVYPEGHFTHLLRYFVSSLGLFFLSLRHFVSSLRYFVSSLGLFSLSLRHFVSSLRYFVSSLRYFVSSLGLFFLLLRHFVSSLRLLTSTEEHFTSMEGHLTSSEGHRLHSDILQEAKKAFVEGSERCFQYLFLWEILLNRSAKALPNAVPATAPVRISSGK